MRETYSTPCRTPHVTKEKRKKERCQWRGSVSRFVDWPAGPRCAEGLQCVKRQRAGRMSASCVPLRERCVRAAHLVCLFASICKHSVSIHVTKKKVISESVVESFSVVHTLTSFGPMTCWKHAGATVTPATVCHQHSHFAQWCQR